MSSMKVPDPASLANISSVQEGCRPEKLRAAIVIPVYNSETTIERLCQQLITDLSPFWRLQIVLIDDGSVDRSAAVCRSFHERYPDTVACVFLAKNFGEHNAVMAGLNYAEGDYVVIMDDDFQNPTREADRMLREVAKGFDVVYARYEQKQHSLWRNLGSRLHNAMATYALGKPKRLYLSSFKAMSRFLVQEVIKYRGPDPYLDAIILRVTRNIGVLAVSHGAREDGASGYTFAKLLGLWGNMIVAFSIYPLRAIGLYGLITAMAGILYSGYKLVEWVSPTLPDPDRFETLNASIWFFRGSILLTLSIIGEYVGRIYKNLSSAPQFAIRDKLLCRRDNATSPGAL
jgi:undecaprenyl-phosphate 4-deoxy-4-formamido-L-arabinose transferase